MESLKGHRRLPGGAVQGARPAPELWLGNFCLCDYRFTNFCLPTKISQEMYKMWKNTFKHDVKENGFILWMSLCGLFVIRPELALHKNIQQKFTSIVFKYRHDPVCGSV